MKKFSLAFAVALAFMTIPFSNAHADNSPSQTPVATSQTPAEQPKGDDSDKREHSIREDEHGTEFLPIAIVIGSIAVAIGLAIGISHRPR